HVATDEPRLIRGSARCGDGFEHHALICVIEVVNADVRLNDWGAVHDIRVPAQWRNQRGERSSPDEEHEQSDEDPGHTADATFLFRKAGRVSDRRSVLTSRVPTCASSQSESAIPAKAQLRRHRRMAV